MNFKVKLTIFKQQAVFFEHVNFYLSFHSHSKMLHVEITNAFRAVSSAHKKHAENV